MAEITQEADLLTANLFPSTLFCTNLDTNNLQNLLSQVKNIKENEGAQMTGRTETSILDYDEFIAEKKLFTDKINFIFNKFYDNKFKITTSWFTVTKPNGHGEWHKHSNSWYSGVYYFQDFTSEISFRNPIERDIDLVSHKINPLVWNFEPTKGNLILFPSYLYHLVNTNTSNKNRNSLAFNIMPIGNVGVGDSTYEFSP